ncbi:NUDIX hydrolase [Leekyejoonella antrihumi]|uniref:CoA pyrophosphatase n=1 Tax=Leekyejoonella antrihumi TaxID=1660198 RepID=A0A563E4H2_9MICO|nr:CoA pyrophosphatase [Leekyejoonella antrihumi]TWP36774.1 CoA pyrophosphatase [Leekyejoonella antrihumi]
MTIDPKRLQAQIFSKLAAFDHIELPAGGLRAAAVCVPVAVVEGDPVVWLEERSLTLRAHAGQYALPGGRIDSGETAEHAALRELHEEIGIEASPDQIVGRLDDFASRSGYVITPFVVWVGVLAQPPRCNPAEVAILHEVTMEELDVEPRFITIPESDTPVFQWPFHGQSIHAPTAAILHQFREVVLHGRHTRVAHFEQPAFAWK